MREFANVYPVATNTNFYKQCVPDGTCDIIFSVNSANWLRTPPCGFEDAISLLSPHATEDEIRHFRCEAASQWEAFLLLRARELKPGGFLIVTANGVPENYRELVQPHTSDSGKADAITSAAGTYLRFALDLDTTWRDMRDKGFVSEVEYKDFFLPVAMRTAGEVTSPFVQVASPVGRAGLALDYFDEVVLPHPFKDVTLPPLKSGNNENTDQQQYFADQVTLMAKVMTAAYLRNILSDMRSEEEKITIAEQYFGMFRQRVASVHVDSYFSDALFHRLVIKKTG